MVKGKAKAAGSFIGGIFNNPGIVILGIVAITLFLFKDKISQAFADVGAGISSGIGDINIQLPEIKFPEFKFPEIEFPEFPALPDFTNLFAGFQSQLSSIAGQIVTLQGAQVTIPPDTMIDPDTGIVTSETPPTIDSTTGIDTDPSTLFGELRPKVFDTLIDIGISLSKATEILGGAKTIEDLGVILEQANTGIFTQLESTLSKLSGSITPSPQPVQSFLEQPQQFGGGGVSFVGGSVFETPLENLTLNQIINMFNVSASKAASLKAEAIGFEDVSGFIPEGFLTQGSQGLPIGFEAPSFGGFTGDPQFQGLTPQQIINQILGGSIQNF